MIGPDGSRDPNTGQGLVNTKIWGFAVINAGTILDFQPPTWPTRASFKANQKIQAHLRSAE